MARRERLEARVEPFKAGTTYTEVPSDYFDRLLAALDALPEPIKELQRAAARPVAEPVFTQA